MDLMIFHWWNTKIYRSKFSIPTKTYVKVGCPVITGISKLDGQPRAAQSQLVSAADS
jgi:hypothetical protein